MSFFDVLYTLEDRRPKRALVEADSKRDAEGRLKRMVPIATILSAFEIMSGNPDLKIILKEGSES